MTNLGTRAARVIAATALLASTAIAMVGTNTPAQADVSGCTDDQHKSFSTPGFDTDLWVDVCIFSSGYTGHYARFGVVWVDGGDSAADGNRKFDALRLNVRLERYDSVILTASCSIAGDVNRNESGNDSCYTETFKSSLLGGWTSDGTVTYDLDRDGEGSKTWSLTGSPQD
ncbi:MAG TPA: hypothetical protein VIP98_16630 [Microlunatus sp.]